MFVSEHTETGVGFILEYKRRHYPDDPKFGFKDLSCIKI